MTLLPDTKAGAADWMQYAACRDIPTEVFFRDSQLERAKAACGRCPCRNACSAYVRTIPTSQAQYGVWGGEHPGERGGPGSPIHWGRSPRECIICHEPFLPNAPNQSCCDTTCANARKRITNRNAKQRERVA